MVVVIRRIVSESTGSRRMKLNWPVIPHMAEKHVEVLNLARWRHLAEM
jgi:hypothetical protein